MSRREKLYHLHDILRQRRTPVSRQQLMEELGCSQATLYRLIAELRDVLGAPLEQDPDTRYFFYDRSLAGNFELPGLWISPEELQALLTARQILANVQPGLLQDELDMLQQRMSQLIDQEGIDFSAHPERIHIRHDAGRPVPGRLFEDLLRALFQRQRLRIRYHGRRRDEVSERTVSPQRLTAYRDRWYLDAWCHDADGLRSFAVERIQALQPLEQATVELDAAALRDHFDGAYGIFSGPAEHRARLRFNAEAARWAADEQWHAEQQAERAADGTLELSFPFGSSRELVMDVLRYGADVEVLAPAFLREQVADAARRLRAVYDAAS
ncbi:transcriptional regulator [Wenzhouxiangella sp. XN79A]|uniref:helix-turn-helix transcriptional regulator n=1 Tax=Wenzhouxiangella sp. XN79A TaxID=2724193 RepID=UPI00144AF07D|nr:transcriptional regulator [Wenzhouxiangella sp. XN79A]NKI34604.1 transcriptional regulator [Wenzhouxiangella sp. XN79A]